MDQSFRSYLKTIFNEAKAKGSIPRDLYLKLLLLNEGQIQVQQVWQSFEGELQAKPELVENGAFMVTLRNLENCKIKIKKLIQKCDDDMRNALFCMVIILEEIEFSEEDRIILREAIKETISEVDKIKQGDLTPSVIFNILCHHAHKIATPRFFLVPKSLQEDLRNASRNAEFNKLLLAQYQQEIVQSTEKHHLCDTLHYASVEECQLYEVEECIHSNVFEEKFVEEQHALPTTAFKAICTTDDGWLIQRGRKSSLMKKVKM